MLLYLQIFPYTSRSRDYSGNTVAVIGRLTFPVSVTAYYHSADEF